MGEIVCGCPGPYGSKDHLPACPNAYMPFGPSDVQVVPDQSRSILDDIDQAERENNQASRLGGCRVCSALKDMDPEVSRVVARVVDQGTIGSEKLSGILAKNGYPTGRRAILRHRQEGHTP